ncbi:hypothetical protein B296_00021684 [Ensete ventricosum]|uniref:Uncharacterized protein n=1 Tax=Ensete ventricosum TaxID=4639 RepID=A0A427A6I1_ENSVE|nr:hypothetical protein B296_00021684 [Ensete ventricosum]
MRSFVDETQNPLLWASTYHAGECLDPVAVAQAKAKRKAKKLAAPPHSLPKQELDGPSNEQHDDQHLDTFGEAEKIGKKQMAIEGYKAQSEMVIDSLDRLIFAWEERKESAVVEGVHLSLNFVRQGSSRHLMALFNTDGSVAKAWPVESADGKMMSGNVGKNCLTIYGPLQVGKAEEVNLQFGTFGISAWPSDAGGTSHTGSIDDPKADCIDTGSVDEGSTKSDLEFDDLAMQDCWENGYWTDDDEPTNIKKLTSEKKLTRDMSGKIVRGDLTEKKSQNLRSTHKINTRASDPSCYHSLLAENLRSLSLKMKKHLPTNSLRSYRRSQSIPASAKSGL